MTRSSSHASIARIQSIFLAAFLSKPGATQKVEPQIQRGSNPTVDAQINQGRRRTKPRAGTTSPFLKRRQGKDESLKTRHSNLRNLCAQNGPIFHRPPVTPRAARPKNNATEPRGSPPSDNVLRNGDFKHLIALGILVLVTMIVQQQLPLRTTDLEIDIRTQIKNIDEMRQ